MTKKNTPEHKKFNEAEIKKKLYGVQAHDAESRKGAGEDFPEQKSVKKEKQKNKLPSPAEKKPAEKTPPPELQNEIAGLKKEIVSLEDRLKTTEHSKSSLEKKLSQAKDISEPSAKIITPLPAVLKKNLLPGIIAALILPIVIFYLLPKVIPPKTTEEKEGAQLPAEPQSPAAVSLAPQDEKEYTIQVAEYANETAAKQFVKTLGEQGYEVIINTLYRDNNKRRPYFKIDVGLFRSFEEARLFLEKFQKKMGITDAFIKEKK